jgi:hypothetical protein
VNTAPAVKIASSPKTPALKYPILKDPGLECVTALFSGHPWKGPPDVASLFSPMRCSSVFMVTSSR